MRTISENGPILPEVFAPQPLPTGLDRPFWDGLLEGCVVIQRCDSCAGWQFPPEVICHQCRSFELSWRPVEPHGIIHSWTRAWHPANAAFSEHVPYLIVLVELPEAGGIRLIGNLCGDPLQTVRVGMAVSPVFEPHGDRYTLLQWVPAPSSVGGR